MGERDRESKNSLSFVLVSDASCGVSEGRGRSGACGDREEWAVGEGRKREKGE